MTRNKRNQPKCSLMHCEWLTPPPPPPPYPPPPIAIATAITADITESYCTKKNVGLIFQDININLRYWRSLNWENLWHNVTYSKPTHLENMFEWSNVKKMVHYVIRKKYILRWVVEFLCLLIRLRSAYILRTQVWHTLSVSYGSHLWPGNKVYCIKREIES